jgi:hypothetical protein
MASSKINKELFQALREGRLEEEIAKLGAWQRRQIAGQLALKDELSDEERTVLAALRAAEHNRPARGKTLAIRVLGPDGTEEKALAGTTKEIAGQLELTNGWKLASHLLKLATQGKIIVLGCQDSVIDRVLYGKAKGEKGKATENEKVKI